MLVEYYVKENIVCYQFVVTFYIEMSFPSH